MMERVDNLAIETLGLQSAVIWKKVSAERSFKSKTWKGMTDNQVINKVNNIHRKSYGGDALRDLEQPSTGMVQNSNYWLFKFSCAITGNETNKLKRIVGLGNPVILGSLVGKEVQLYIDGAFKIVPDTFYQCLKIMAFDETLGVYVHVLYILMTAKNHWLFYHALH